jgi:hypothetical protein
MNYKLIEPETEGDVGILRLKRPNWNAGRSAERQD